MKAIYKYVLPAVAVVAAASVAGCSGGGKISPEEQRQENNEAEAFGRRQALEFNAALQRDTLEAEMIILDVRSREAELRRRGAPEAADSYINSFRHTLDSVNPGVAAELKD